MVNFTELQKGAVDSDNSQWLTSCPVCNGEALNKRFEKNGFFYMQCNQCKFIFANPRPTLEFLKKVYDENYFESEEGGRKYTELKKSLVYDAEKQLKFVTSAINFPKGASLLDIGCGLGIFLEKAIKKGFNAEGIDLSPASIKSCNEKGLTVHFGAVESYSFNCQYDLITAMDLVEHVSDLDTVIKQIYNLLKPGGYFFFKVPNGNSYKAKKLGKDWREFIAPIHLNFFCNKTSNLLLKKYQFKPVLIYSEPSITLGLRISIIKFEKKINNPTLTYLLDNIEKIICLFKRDIFYPLINRIYRQTGWDGYTVYVIAQK